MSLEQFYNLCYFIFTGIIIAMLFDIFRILRKSFKTSDIITYLHDFLFWIFTGAILLFSIFKFNNGEIRGYIFIGIILGIMIHILIISNYFIKLSVKIIGFLKKIIGYPIQKCYYMTKKYVFSPISHIFCKIKLKSPKINIKNKKNDNLSNKIQ